jgi:hypothetical protein
MGSECGTDMKTLGVRAAQTFGNFTAGYENFMLNNIN